MKKLAALFCAALLLIYCGCSDDTVETNTDDGRLNIVASNFPAYDFAREICGESAHITLLIKPGAELHSYEPSPKDIIKLQSCDLFICNGGESEAWIEELLESGELNYTNILRMMDCVSAVEESDEGIYGHEHEHDDGETAELDEHVWTSPVNAQLIVSAITQKLCELAPDCAEEFSVRSEAYTAQLMELDSQFRAAVKDAKRTTLVFADRFPMRYFTLEYGLDYAAAFPGCATETEPSAKMVAYLIDKVREEDIPAVLYLEFSNERMADVICEDTGCTKLPFYSVHNITAEQFEDGVGYLELMRINLRSLTEALS